MSLDPKGKLRRHAPYAYKACVHLRGAASKHLTGRKMRQRATERLLLAGTGITADVDGAMGIGGVLSNAGRALHLSRIYSVDVSLRFSAPTYAPSWRTEDWLDCYFDRIRIPRQGGRIVPVRLLPTVPEMPFDYLAALVWDTIAISSEIVAMADKVTPQRPFAAVHYRGSDKYLESPPVAAAVVLDRLEDEMRDADLTRVFVASDEATFLDLARERFGSQASILDCQALAANGKPPHFSDTVPGETKAVEALQTMLLLARAALCVRTDSLLSRWAMTLPGNRRAVRVTPAAPRH